MTFRIAGIRRSVTAAALAAIVCLALPAPAAQAAPPTPPTAAEARGLLTALATATEGSSSGYDRDKFPHWSDQGGGCSTREVVLERDGSGVETGSDCYPTAGSWFSVYDGATWSDPADVDIDHVVPLAEAWRSGAADWTTERREEFANDTSLAQLIAVTDNVNQSKGDQDPAEWLPPLASYHCVYARSWVWVKDAYGMSVDSAERTALEDVLTGC